MSPLYPAFCVDITAIAVPKMSSGERIDGEERSIPSTQHERPDSSTSCTKYFDALWFCYSPVHQLKRYYVHGDVDDCTSHWVTLMACLKQKTRFRLSDEDEALPPQPCMWTVRSPEEARTFWAEEFGGTKESDSRQGGAAPMA